MGKGTAYESTENAVRRRMPAGRRHFAGGGKQPALRPEALYPPFESKSASGKLEGFDIELGDAACAAAQLKCSWVETSFDSLIPALQARKFDAINSAMNVTEQRRQAIAFTDAIYQVPNRLIAKADSGLLPDAKPLAGKHVGVLQAIDSGDLRQNPLGAGGRGRGVLP